MLVDGSTVFRRVALSGFVDSSEDGAKQFFSQDDECCHGRDGLLRNSVSAGVRELADQAFATELFDVVETGGIDPTLADLAQAPCSPGFGQGVCDFGQICGLRDEGETVPLFCKGDADLLGAAGYVLMTIEYDLCTEWRVARHLDGDMGPSRGPKCGRSND